MFREKGKNLMDELAKKLWLIIGRMDYDISLDRVTRWLELQDDELEELECREPNELAAQLIDCIVYHLDD